MENLNFTNIVFHDAAIEYLDFNNQMLQLSFSNVAGKDLSRKLIMNVQIEEDDIRIFLLKQYPFANKVKLKGKEISISCLKSFLQRNIKLQVVDTLIAIDSNLVVFDCTLFPYVKKRGVFRKILLKLYCDHNKVILEEQI